MNWYIAKVIFRIISSNETGHRAQFDEQLRLVNAASKCDAFKKATLLGNQIAETFLANKQLKGKWQFVNVAEVRELDHSIDGAELYCQIHEPKNAELYVGWANHQAALLNFEN